MPILCLEGASSVGKSITCQEIVKRYNAYIVQEVNAIFKRPDPMPEYWYLERQIERWQIANEKLDKHELVLFDGDIFQPLWYNWCYDFKVFGLTLEKLQYFYRLQLENRSIGFPDNYFLLYINEAELRLRKEGDQTRRRGNFDFHLQMIEPQKRYFNVRFIEATSIQQNIELIMETKSTVTKSMKHTFSLELIDGVCGWLRKNRAVV